VAKKKKINGKKDARITEEAILPEEVKLLQEFNKVHEGRYNKWVRRKMVTEEILGKYTLVAGVRGQNGIVLGADTKVIRGGETDYEQKVRKFDIGP